MLDFFSWGAVVVLSVGYWLQVWKIHVHREVRDISLPYYILLAIGFATLAITAWYQQTPVFLVKNVLTFIPVVVTICQIIYHRQDTWHDPEQPFCTTCKEEIELHWTHCPYCGTGTPSSS